MQYPSFSNPVKTLMQLTFVLLRHTHSQCQSKVIDQQTGNGVLSQLSMIAAGDVRSGGARRAFQILGGSVSV
jgi:hypothetical protein